MATLRACAVICVAATFLACAGVACGEVRGVQMVGAGIPPDTLLQDDRETDHCTFSNGHSASGPGFSRWTSGRTMALSPRRTRCVNGSSGWACRRCSSNPGVPRRAGTPSHSTRSCATSFSTESSSRVFGRHES